MGKVSESIFSSGGVVIPMADVQHVEKDFDLIDGKRKGPATGCMVITKHTKWNFEYDIWENAIYLNADLTVRFLNAWCFYRSELEGNLMGHHETQHVEDK